MQCICESLCAVWPSFPSFCFDVSDPRWTRQQTPLVTMSVVHPVDDPQWKVLVTLCDPISDLKLIWTFCNLIDQVSYLVSTELSIVQYNGKDQQHRTRHKNKDCLFLAGPAESKHKYINTYMYVYKNTFQLWNGNIQLSCYKFINTLAGKYLHMVICLLCLIHFDCLQDYHKSFLQFWHNLNIICNRQLHNVSLATWWI